MANKRERVLVVLAIAVLAVAAPAAAQDECAACHEEVVKHFGSSAHGRYFAGAKQYRDATCISCHIGAKEHAASGGDKKPLDLRRAAPGDANTPCLTCHGGHKKTAMWEGSAHQRANLRCTSCHEVHSMHIGTPEQARTLPGPTQTTKRCLECHGTLRHSLNARSRHPLQNGQMQCASCHNPHGTIGEKLIDRGSVNELCYSCHQNVRGSSMAVYGRSTDRP